jgi:hypothetical protein
VQQRRRQALAAAAAARASSRYITHSKTAEIVTLIFVLMLVLNGRQTEMIVRDCQSTATHPATRPVSNIDQLINTRLLDNIDIFQ